MTLEAVRQKSWLLNCIIATTETPDFQLSILKESAQNFLQACQNYIETHQVNLEFTDSIDHHGEYSLERAINEFSTYITSVINILAEDQMYGFYLPEETTISPSGHRITQPNVYISILEVTQLLLEKANILMQIITIAPKYQPTSVHTMPVCGR